MFYATTDFNKIEAAKDLYEAKNNRDTSRVQELLHENFNMIDDDGTKDWDKKKWIEKMWCKSCYKDTLEILSVEEKEGVVLMVTRHKSEVLRLLDIPYFSDLDHIYFQDNRIIKIVRDTMPGNKAQSKVADEKFEKFSVWLYHHYPEANIDDPSIIPLLEKYASKKNKKKKG